MSEQETVPGWMWDPGWLSPAQRSAEAFHPVSPAAAWVFPAEEPELSPQAGAPGFPDRESEAVSGFPFPVQEPVSPAERPESGPMHFPRGQAPVFRCRIRDAVFPLKRPEKVLAFPGCFQYPAALYGQKELLPALPGSPPAPGLWLIPKQADPFSPERVMATGSAWALE